MEYSALKGGKDFSIKYRPHEPGYNLLNIRYGGEHIKGRLWVKPSLQYICNSNCFYHLLLVAVYLSSNPQLLQLSVLISLGCQDPFGFPVIC